MAQFVGDDSMSSSDEVTFAVVATTGTGSRKFAGSVNWITAVAKLFRRWL
jgi:hypothetical protein